MINLFMSHYKKKSYFNAARFCFILKFFLNQDCSFSFIRIGAEFGRRRCLALWIGWVTWTVYTTTWHARYFSATPSGVYAPHN